MPGLRFPEPAPNGSRAAKAAIALGLAAHQSDARARFPDRRAEASGSRNVDNARAFTEDRGLGRARDAASQKALAQTAYDR